MNLPSSVSESTHKRNPALFKSQFPECCEEEQPEKKLHADIIEYCRRRGWIVFHGSMATRSHRVLGEPDATILANHGQVYFIEMKTKKGKVTPEQQGMIHHAARLGHTISVVRSLEQFRALVE